MRLVMGTQGLAEAELASNSRLAILLQASVPASWPPEALRDALPVFLAQLKRPSQYYPWYLGWYGILMSEGAPVLCGSIGFKGAPCAAGVVEVGYSVLPEYQGRGIATEMVLGAATWALDQAGVRAVEAEADPTNIRECGPGLDPNTCRFRLLKSAR
jgi:[ribosomal protein S5]-alanine N-acetyltransferase